MAVIRVISSPPKVRGAGHGIGRGAWRSFMAGSIGVKCDDSYPALVWQRGKTRIYTEAIFVSSVVYMRSQYQASSFKLEHE
jgi:hypothetical protein